MHPLITNPTESIDISEIFSDPENSALTYEVIAGDSEYLTVNLTDDSQLELTALPKTGTTTVAIQGTDEAGNSVVHSFDVTTSNLHQELVDELDNALDDLTAVLQENPEDLVTGLVSPGGEEALDRLEEIIAETPDIVKVLTEPEALSELGFDEEGIAAVQELLDSPEVGELLGLPGSVSEALNNPNSGTWDEFLINAPADAIALLSEDADLPAVGFLDDFTDGHGENVTKTFESINPKGSYDNIQVQDGNWAEQLKLFVDNLKNQGHDRGIANLSFDLSQVDDRGQVTTRYELTPEEWQAIQYARDNNVLLVVASGNTGDRMSGLGAAAREFDNIIAVGAVNSSSEAADYASRGEGLTLVAPGGEYKDDRDAFVGTSKAASYVTGAASMVWGANPDLNYQQVKDILTQTAKDLGPEGWDRDTGAGLLDVVEAMMMAAWVAPEPLVIDREDEEKTSFSGAGRVRPSQRAASAATEAEIAKIRNIQERLFAQLGQLSDENLTAAELSEAVNQRRQAGLEAYQQASNSAGIAKAEFQQSTAALYLATNHYQLELGRQQALLARQQELQAQMALLTQEKAELEKTQAQQSQAIQGAIGHAEEDLARAEAKREQTYELVAPENLLLDAQQVLQSIEAQQAIVQGYRRREQELISLQHQYAAEGAHLAGQANHHRHLSNISSRWGNWYSPWWQHNLISWDLGRRASGAARKSTLANWNSNYYRNVANETDARMTGLNGFAQFVEKQYEAIASLKQGDVHDASKLIGLLQEWVTEQERVTRIYWDIANSLELRRLYNQQHVNHHHNAYIHGEWWHEWNGGRHWSNHWTGLEFIPPRDFTQQMAGEFDAQYRVWEQYAWQSQQQVDAMRKEIEALGRWIGDYSTVQQGIEYEIAAEKLNLQGQQDLQALQTPLVQQQLETVDRQIQQVQSELDQIAIVELGDRAAKVEETENRLQAIQSEWEARRLAQTVAQKKLQEFLETYGYQIPYQKRREVLIKRILELEAEQISVLEAIKQLGQPLDVTEATRLDLEQRYLEEIERDLAWTQVQLEQLNLSAPDSPQRLEISALISELSERLEAGVETNTLPLPQYLDFLGEVSSRNRDLLTGLDDLETRLERAKQEQAAAERAQPQLEEEYRHLGLEKASLEAEISEHHAQIDVKDGEIATTSEEIVQTEATLTGQKDDLAAVEAAQAQKQAEIDAQQQVIDGTLTQIGETQAQISAKNAAIAQQQSELQGYHGQIASAYTVAQQHEQARNHSQNAANYWNGQIHTWGITHHRWESYRYKSGKKWKTGWRQVPVYGWIYHPHAEAQRNSNQAAANQSAYYRDLANAQAQELEASLQPAIAATQGRLAQLELEKQPLVELERQLLGQLSHQQGELQQIEQERQAIIDEVNAMRALLAATQQQLDGLNAQLNSQREQREALAARKADLEGQLRDKETHLADKYREIELTEQYLQQVNSEVSRLESRLELLNRAEVLEKDYQTQSTAWNEAIATQIAATEALLTTRQAGVGDRTQLISLQSQQRDIETELAAKQQQQLQLQQEVADAQQALDLTQLQLGNQQLQLQSLQGQDWPLQSAEHHYYNLAQQERHRMWYWNGHTYAYNAGAANAYRYYLQKASLLADERNEVWQQRQSTRTKIAELTAQQATQTSQLNSAKNQLTATDNAVAQLTAQAAAVQQAIAPLQETLAPLQAEEQAQRQAFSEAIAHSENKSAELAQTTREQVTALERAIGFGVLASESDIDFFGTQVEPKVSEFIAQLSQRSQDFQAQGQQLTQLIDDWQGEMAGTTDPVILQALQDLITQTQATRDALLTWERENADAAEQLSQRLDEAKAALKPLQQQQELELREQLNGNEERLTALERLLSTENAVDNAIADDTVLGYASANDQINKDK